MHIESIQEGVGNIEALSQLKIMTPLPPPPPIIFQVFSGEFRAASSSSFPSLTDLRITRPKLLGRIEQSKAFVRFKQCIIIYMKASLTRNYLNKNLSRPTTGMILYNRIVVNEINFLSVLHDTSLSKPCVLVQGVH